MTTKTVISVAAALASGMVLAAHAGAAPNPLTAPAVPGVPAPPGPVAAAAPPAANMGALATTPDTGIAGSKVTVSGSALPAGTDSAMTWNTASGTWVVGPGPD